MVATLVGVLALGGARGLAQGAEPYILISWRAESYVPANYTGKVLPTTNSPVVASLDAIDSRTGKTLNLSKMQIDWYLNDNLTRSGAGLVKIAFRATAQPESVILLRAEVPDFPGFPLVRTVRVPVVAPEAVIAAPYANNKFSAQSISVKAAPFFFNAPGSSAFVFSWSVNGNTPTGAENPDSLTVNIIPGTPVGTAFTVRLLIQNSVAAAETAADTIKLMLTQ